MAKKKTWNRLTEESYAGIKSMQKAGVDKSQAVKATGRGINTIKLVYLSNTFAEYQKLMKERNDQYRESKLAKSKPQLTLIEEVKPIESRTEDESKDDDTQLRIAVALERIADSLEKQQEPIPMVQSVDFEPPVKSKIGIFKRR